MRTLGIVTARGGSKRIARKNLKPLGGQTLVDRAIDVGLAARTVTRVVVSSEDDEILASVKRRDPALALKRPEEYATDESPVIECVRHALDTLEGAGDERYDAIVVLHPTSPLRLPEDIDATVELMQRTGANAAVSVVKVNHMVHPIKLKVMQGDRLRPYIEEERGRRMAHQLPEVYVRNCAVYVATRELVDTNVLIVEDCPAHVMPSERSVDINEPLDLEFAEFLLAKRSS